jgi:hypothetical protein
LPPFAARAVPALTAALGKRRISDLILKIPFILSKAVFDRMNRMDRILRIATLGRWQSRSLRVESSVAP